MRAIVVAAALAVALLVGSGQALADVHADVQVYADAGETAGLSSSPTKIDQTVDDDGAAGVAAAASGWPLAAFPVLGDFDCPATGCADRSGGATASVDEAAGTLRAGAGASILVGNAPDADYGGVADILSEASVDETVTLSKAATVLLEGTVHGTLASSNSNPDLAGDPRVDTSVKVDFCCQARPFEGPRPLGGYEQDFSPAAADGSTEPIDDSFSIPVDLPAGDTQLTADLRQTIDLLIDGEPNTLLAQSALADFGGTVTFHLVVPDDVAATSSSGLLPIVGGGPPADAFAPTTTATPSPAPQWDDWNGGPVTVHLAATDTGGSGVESITYGANGAQTLASTSAPGDSVDVPITAEGVTTLTYFATDAAGNAETPQTLTVKIDETGPTASATISPQPNAAGWNGANNTPATVTLHADDDAGVGVASITYADAGAETTGGDITATSDTHAPTFSTTQTFSTNDNEGVTTITYHATDLLGNVGPTQTTTVRFDTFPPTVTLPGYGGALVVDATGPDGAVATWDLKPTDNVDPSPAVSCDHASGVVFPIGITKATCTISDVAGNTTTASFLVDVRGAVEQIDLYLPVNGPGMWAKWVSAEIAARVGHVHDACGELKAYMNELRAISGKWVDSRTAAEKLSDAGRIRRVLGCGSAIPRQP